LFSGPNSSLPTVACACAPGCVPRAEPYNRRGVGQRGSAPLGRREDSMPLSLTCSCGVFLEVDDKFAGQKINCPDCQAALQVPALQRSATHTSGLAIASLMLALVGAFTVVGTVAAVGLGALALRQIRKRPEEIAGRNMAQAGIILGSVLTLLSLAAYGLSDRI